MEPSVRAGCPCPSCVGRPVKRKLAAASVWTRLFRERHSLETEGKAVKHAGD